MQRLKQHFSVSQPQSDRYDALTQRSWQHVPDPRTDNRQRTVTQTRDHLGVVIDHELSLAVVMTAACRAMDLCINTSVNTEVHGRAGYSHQLRKLRPVARSLSVHMPPRCLYTERSFHVAWTTATHCCTASMTGYFAACSRHRMPPHGWSQAFDHISPVLRQLHRLPDFQSVSESRSRSCGWCTSH